MKFSVVRILIILYIYLGFMTVSSNQSSQALWHPDPSELSAKRLACLVWPKELAKNRLAPCK